MMGLFKRTSPPVPPDLAALGSSALVLPVSAGVPVPSACIGVVFDQGGSTRRIAAGGRIDCSEHERAACFHPGPYSCDLQPFPGAPELGLHLTFAVDGPDPRVARQRFDLFVASEAAQGIALDRFCDALDAALQRELAQGSLALPPCTSLAEWDAFRAGLNELLYTRFGITVDDCVPVDLGERVDYAAMLLARAQAAPQRQPGAQHQVLAPLSDAQALRRLFLELPCVTGALRLIALPPGQALFRQHQAVLQQLAHISLDVATMPALALAAPNVPLDLARQSLRAAHSMAAVRALDEAWALLARAAAAAPETVVDDAARIAANLELACAARRLTP